MTEVDCSFSFSLPCHAFAPCAYASPELSARSHSAVRPGPNSTTSNQQSADNSTLTADAAESCAGPNTFNGKLDLRIASVFVILVTSLFGTLLPIVSRRLKSVPDVAYRIVKYFGSGVIIATAFIHLLAPAWDALTSPCLQYGVWVEYDWAPAIAMISMFSLFLVELVAHRAGASYLAKRGLRAVDAHSQGNNQPSHSTHGAHIDDRVAVASSPLEDLEGDTRKEGLLSDDESEETASLTDEAVMARIIGVAILEFGVIFHSLMIGLTLAVDPDFSTLFVVLIFHQMFEGLGLGSRLSALPLPHAYRWVPYIAGTVYACVTPLGIAIGLGVRTTYNPNTATASIVSGVLDATSAGILLYTGLVELLAHDFIFNKEMARDASNVKVAGSVLCVLVGAGIMSLLGRWA
ncbi:BQ5605_C019g08963 [Microbotryum silenes-dioicae]|uniref:BQ5605_C019g08963 protein n=1 Tax=Microbotryum silenes-dioicae TaxID=796604 RepID=A0A2X0P030_9BASI|nr:BQ5605_C019g08963 [Microbotryum silenes-dioicae]